nr:hypothetical protein [Tanacetum cinerariifolium]
MSMNGRQMHNLLGHGLCFETACDKVMINKCTCDFRS